MRQIKRVGAIRILDVLAFQLFYKLFLRQRDVDWMRQTMTRLQDIYPPISQDVPVLITDSPNSPATEAFLRQHTPDIMIARCKVLLKKRIYAIPPKGTFVFHPGICPEYRNAHGCFWALVNRDLDKVGLTVLQIDDGVDTGPVYGYFTYDYDEGNESHVVIQFRVLLENLGGVRDVLLRVFEGKARPININGRTSRTWGQPWLTSYLRWKLHTKVGR
jgi:hypothetical protein